MVREQLLGTLNSHVSNRPTDFRTIALQSTVEEVTWHMLLVVNETRAWFDLSRQVVV